MTFDHYWMAPYLAVWHMGLFCMSPPGEWWPCGSLSNCTQAPRTSYPHWLDKSQEKIDLEKKKLAAEACCFRPDPRIDHRDFRTDTGWDCQTVSVSVPWSFVTSIYTHFYPSPRTQWDQEKVGAHRKAFASTGGLWVFFMVFSHAQYGENQRELEPLVSRAPHVLLRIRWGVFKGIRQGFLEHYTTTYRPLCQCVALRFSTTGMLYQCSSFHTDIQTSSKKWPKKRMQGCMHVH